MIFPAAFRAGGRSALFSNPSTKSDAGHKSFNPCWY